MAAAAWSLLPLFPMTTRRQHYVWQKYLEPWTTRKNNAQQLWCLRKNSRIPFQTETKNVAVERDFYRLRDLDETDGDFVRSVAFGDRTNQTLRELNEGWIAGFEALFELHKAARFSPNASQSLREALDAQLIEHQEQQYSRMETDAVEHLAALQVGDVSFFEDDDQAISFCYFLAHQYFRTKAIRDRIKKTHDTAKRKDRFNRTWPLFRYVFATNVGYAIFEERKTVKLRGGRAPPGIEFITGDQPAVNTYGAFIAANVPVEDVELYYPVSPTRAVVLSGHRVYQNVHGIQLAPFRANYLNQTIERIAYEQLFAKSEATLRAVASEFCKTADW